MPTITLYSFLLLISTNKDSPALQSKGKARSDVLCNLNVRQHLHQGASDSRFMQKKTKPAAIIKPSLRNPNSDNGKFHNFKQSWPKFKL